MFYEVYRRLPRKPIGGALRRPGRLALEERTIDHVVVAQELLACHVGHLPTSQPPNVIRVSMRRLTGDVKENIAVGTVEKKRRTSSSARSRLAAI
jgi:hypothetical protein